MSKASVKKPAKKPVAKTVAKKAAAKPLPKAAKPVAKPAPKKPVAKPLPKVAKPVAKASSKKPVAKPLPKVAKPAPKATVPVAPKPEDPKVAPKKPVMKKMVVKLPKVKPVEPEFVNNAKDFAFAIAESMKNAAAKAAAKKPDASTVKLSRRPTTRKAGQDTLKFSASDLAQFRRSLIALREQVVGKTATLKNVALEQTIDRVGEDEDGSDSFMRLQNLGQVDEQNKVIQRIDEALRRIEDGTYGICEVCGQLIRKPRLLNLPFVHTCMECQSEMEGANR